MRSRQYSRTRNAAVIRWIGGLVSVLLLTLLGFTLLMALFLVALQKSATFREWMRRFNKRMLNPAMLRNAGRPRSPYAVIHHVGRRSGHPYATPVRVRTAPDGFIIPLPYGRDVDWCRNVLAAGGGVITWQGKDVAVGEPQVTDFARVLRRVPLPAWRVWLWDRLLTYGSLGQTPCLWIQRLSISPQAQGAIRREGDTVLHGQDRTPA